MSQVAQSAGRFPLAKDKASTARQNRFFDTTSSAFTPREGWTTVAFLLAMNLVVIAAVEQARWVTPTPRLWVIGILGFGFSLATVKLRGPIALKLLLHVLLLALGFGIALLETAGTLSGAAPEKIAETITRLASWTNAILSEGISNDKLPFVLILGLSTWIVVYLSVLFTFGFRWPWLAVIPPAVGLMTHQTYRPAETYPLPLFSFLLFAILFMGQTHLIRRPENAVLPLHSPLKGKWTSLASLLILTITVLVLSWALPVRHLTWGPLRDSYLASREPYDDVETGLERMFAGIPSQKAGQLRNFGGALALRGIGAGGDTPVLTVATDFPAYWRGQTYDFYQGQGWLARQEREVVSSDDSPIAERPADGYKKQVVIAQQITLETESDVLFTGGQPAEISIRSNIELSTPKTYTLSLAKAPAPGSLPSDLYDAATRINGSGLSVQEIRAFLPSGTQIVGTTTDSVTVTRAAPGVPDVLSVRPPKRLEGGTTYEVLSLASFAGADDLRADVTQYPRWVLDTYLQLPSTTPQRVKDLALEITRGATNPYDKAEAIQHYLRSYKQAEAIEPPPVNVDAVDYFLFTRRAGYSDYFASSMTVLLRAANVPARLAAGYSSGDYDEETGAFTVRQNDAHSWPEVFFPTYGWIHYEPLPSLGTIGRGGLRQMAEPSSGEVDEPESGIYPEEEPEEEDVFGGDLVPDDSTFVDRLFSSGGKVLGLAVAILGGGALLAALVGAALWQLNFLGMSYTAGMYARMSLLGALAWRGPARSETPREYAFALSNALALRPDYSEAIAHGFVKGRYGTLEATTEDRIAIERAWRGTRQALVRRLGNRLNVIEMLRRD
ncbi:MAG: Protein-glutamine gamma-glutamyltransferase [Dehalococcoidia bacterium]|nr:Protein-glutamine gamma-glutamyltransferase [Dehalococcoidia bacterium]